MPKDEHTLLSWTLAGIGAHAAAKLNFYMAASDPDVSQEVRDGIIEVWTTLEDLRRDPFSFDATPLAAPENYYESIIPISHGTLRLRYLRDPSKRWISVDVICCRPCLRDLMLAAA